MKTPHTLVASLLALAAASAFAACSSVEPSPAQIGVDPASLDAGSDADVGADATEGVDADAAADANTGADADAGRDAEADAASDADACTPETNAELVQRACADVGKDCGSVAVTDRCGVARTVMCGTCDPNGTKNECNAASNQCECRDRTSDSDVVRSFCASSARNCGDPEAKDRCGVTRSGSCGTCDAASGAACGATGVCGCPNSAATGLAFVCGNRCVRNCLQSCETAPNSCNVDGNRCVSACSASTCAGRTTVCTTFVNSAGRSLICTALADGGACAPFSAPCSATPDAQGRTLGQQCGFSAPRAAAVCVLGDAGPGECFYCGAAGTNGLPCGGGGTCVAATRTCQ